MGSEMPCSKFTGDSDRSTYKPTSATLTVPTPRNAYDTNSVNTSSQNSMVEFNSQGHTAKSFQHMNHRPISSHLQSYDNQPGSSKVVDDNGARKLSYPDNRNNEAARIASVNEKSESKSLPTFKLPSKRALANFLSEDSPFAKKYGISLTKLLFEKFKRQSNHGSMKDVGHVYSNSDETHETVSSSTNPRSHSQGIEDSDTSFTGNSQKMFDNATLPDTSSSEKISSRKDRKWSLGTHNLCKVCGDKAAGYYCGAFVCEACKKFFMRASKQQKLKYCCIKDQNCVITKESRVQCQYCRYQKCLSLNMSCPDPSTIEKKGDSDISDIPCRVCGAPSSGFHFGALTCEGCKGFFRRMAKERETRHYQCSKNEACEITSMTRNLCKACRYKKCIDAGMSIEASRIGRQPNSVKHAISLELQHMGQNPQACNLDFKNLNDPSKQFDSSEHVEIQDTELSDVRVKVKVEPNELSASNNFRKTPPPTCSSEFSPSLQCNENFEDKYQRMMESIAAMNLELLNLIVRSEKSKPENDPSNFTDHKKCWAFMLIEFENHAACLIKFSKRILGFRKLSLDDQINLVQDSIYPIVILNQSRLFDLENKVIHYFNYTSWEHQRMLEYYPQLRELINHFMHAGEIVKTVDFDDMEITFLSILLLLNPGKYDL
ncbi:hypothetical protein FSP39_021118 [Pinctada imbricata]|uniref:Uncharacterized protein n=1 Tax=Pinctada imbricata TaxID=66713 RepID=A0AA88XXS1_PINIB|nr:hypothetical protein FSP39_021118 [Pinctada imbricata]